MDALGNPQSVLLVGGTSEIGLAICRRLVASRGRRLVLAGRSADDLRAAGSRVLDASPAVSVEPVALDLARTDDHVAVIAEVFATGDIDVAVLAGGVLGDQRRMLADPASAVHTAQVNYVGTMSVALAVAARMREQGHGVLVVLSSAAGQRGRRSNFVYGSTKAGIDVFSQGLSEELHGSGVRVVIVRPGFVHTRMTAGLPAAPLAVEADDVGKAVAEAVAGRRDVVWVPATMRWAMAVLRSLPSAAVRRLDL
jgi:decaprenylphospho-beta-D-erythro-pentofuranosid-2-ulose 2-reductase